MAINPITGIEEEDELSKLLSQFDADRMKLKEEQSGFDGTGALAGALAGLGAAFQGKDSGAAVGQVLDRRNKMRQDEVSALDKWKQGKIAEIQAKRENDKFQREDSLRALEDSPDSEETRLLRQLGSKAVPGIDFSKMTGTQIKERLPSIEKLATIEAQKRNADENRLYRESVLAMNRGREDRERADKTEEKMQGLKTPFGLANTVDDAKQLKSGFEAKENFDSKIQEMIDLRKQYGTEYFNREAVGRGKQLASDLLLAYKDMAKLGVLSEKDTAILNSIIPEDPLANDWAPGQDPILSKLEKFKGDSDKDFQNKIATRTRSGVESAATPVAADGTVMVIDPSGRKRKIPRSQVAAALKAGGQLDTSGMAGGRGPNGSGI
jgi:hypothetical protein